MKKQSILKYKLPTDWNLLFVLSLMAIIEFFPIINIVPRILISLLELLLVGLALLFMACKNRRLFFKNIIIMLCVLIISLISYFNCYISMYSIASYSIKIIMCWFYISLGVYVSKYASRKTIVMAVHLILLLLVITSITSIIVVTDYPSAMRELGNGNTSFKGFENYFYRRNTATWSIVYAMAFTLPYTIAALKKTKKLIYAVISVALFFCIFRSQIMMALLMAIALIMIGFFKHITNKRIIITLGISLLAVWFLSDQIASFIYWMYINFFGSTTESIIGRRLYQLYISLTGKELVGTYGARFDLYMTSLKTFFENPIFGIGTLKTDISLSDIYSFVGLHSQIFDTLATTGIIGSSILAYFFIFYFKKEKCQIIDENDKNIFSVTILMLIALMVMNPTDYSACVYFVIWLGPAYLNTLKKAI